MKATFGWFHLSYGKRKYCQVRSTGSQETGGTFECMLGIQDDYDCILNKATSVFVS